MTDGTIGGKETVVKIEEIRDLQGNTPTTTGNMYAWNQKGGVVASSTGNMSGIYDLVGGTWEITASYIANGHDNLLTYGKSVTYEVETLRTTSTKYTMVYPYDSNVDNNTKEENTENLNAASSANYLKNTKIYGDAIRETSSDGASNSTWNEGFLFFPGLNYAFIVKGGYFCDKTHVGTFSIYRNEGISSYHGAFRPVVVPV